MRHRFRGGTAAGLPQISIEAAGTRRWADELCSPEREGTQDRPSLLRIDHLRDEVSEPEERAGKRGDCAFTHVSSIARHKALCPSADSIETLIQSCLLACDTVDVAETATARSA